MKGLVIYKGKYGSTEQYAKWIAEELKTEPRDARSVKRQELETADYVVIGSSVHMGKMTVAPYLKKWWPALSAKKVFFYSTSGMPPEKRTELEAYFAASVPERLKDHSYFPAGGKIDPTKYGFIMKMLMGAVAKSEFSKNNPGKPVPSDIGSRITDGVDRKWIGPLIQAVKALK